MLEPEFGFGEADFATGLEVCKAIRINYMDSEALGTAYRADGWNINVLYALLSLYLSINSSRSGRYEDGQSSHIYIRKSVLPAAAAGS